MKRSNAIKRAVIEVWPLLGLCAAVTAVSLGLEGPGAALNEGVELGLIYLIMVVGLYVFVGLTGVVSFGQVSFMGVGAYVCAMFTMPQVSKAVFIPGAPSIFRDFELNTTEGVLAGAAVAVVLAVIVSFPLMRLSGIGASIGTLALLMITYTFFNSWTPGPSGGGNLTMIPEDMTVGKLLVWSVVILVVVYLYQRSRFGLRARASGEDEVAARAVGINIGRERRIAFVLSAGIFGAAGGLYGHYLGSFSAGDFYLSLTFVSLAMLVFGGSRSLFGAVLGSGLLSALSYVVTQWENGSSAFGITLSVPTGTSDLTFAVVLILVLLFLPDGLTKGRELPFPHFALHGGWPLGGARRRIGEGGPPAGLVAQAGVVASVAGSVDHGVHGSPTGDEE